MRHTRSSWALPSRAAVPPARRSAGSVLNMPFQGRLLPLKQRVNEWQAISVTRGEISRDAS
jgi:hypothetical protein